MEKVYLAVVWGTPKQSEWTCRLKLAPDPECGGPDESGCATRQGGGDAFPGAPEQGEYTLVEAHPVTGRTHQIRVHLAESGHPVVGDRLYGPRPAKEERTPLSEDGPLTPALSPSEGEREDRRQGSGV